MNPALIVTTMAKRGMLGPGRPSRIAAQVGTMRRWGLALDGEIRAAAARAPSDVAIIDDRRGQITYGALLDESDRLAAILQSEGLGAGDRIGIVARNHVGAVIAMAAASMLGVDVVIVNVGLGPAATADIVATHELRLIVVDDDLADLVAEVPSTTLVLTEAQIAARLAALPRRRGTAYITEPPRRPGRTIILTSGTTGSPKGAARRTPRGPGPLISIIDRIPLRAKDRVLISAPLFHTWGYAALQLALGLRCTVVLQRRFDADAARHALATHRCRAMFAVPVMLQRMLELPDSPVIEKVRRSVRVVATSGSAYPAGVPTAFMDRYGDVLYNLYGSTEASWVCIATPADLRTAPTTVGRPPLATRVEILDEQLTPVPTGHVGRIYCGNDMVFSGYTHGDAGERHEGMVGLGDLGHVDADGLFYVDGRVDDMIISGGENVHPGPVEHALTTHPAVRNAAVVGVPDDEFGQRLAAFIVTAPGAHVTAGELRDHVKLHVARHAVPRDVHFVADLPRNEAGKVVRSLLRPPT